ncbi:MAG: Dyp-type peroxidase [Gammaproteobacteria bacterium]|nr:Dyp-type peroxidase [Gammaproteobacteria bacterium]
MDLQIVQQGIYDDIPLHGRFLFFQLNHQAQTEQVKSVLNAIQSQVDGQSVVLGLGDATLNALNAKGLESLQFPTYDTRGVQVPSTPAALWIWLRGDDLGDITLQAQNLASKLEGAFTLDSSVDAFKYKEGRDLTGYEDGTENPEGEEAFATAFTQTGGSYVAIQQWQHDLAHFKQQSQDQQDDTIGRRLSDNEELDDAPESAHVKRTEQEGFDPEIFLLRRSMAYGEGLNAGLVFQAFAATTQSFATMMAKMVGEEDGIVDALFNFTRPITGAFFWCPPMKNGQPDFSLIF